MQLQLDPKKVTVLVLFLQRLFWSVIIAALGGITALTQNDPNIFGGAGGAMLVYTLITTLKDYLNPKIPNL